MSVIATISKSLIIRRSFGLIVVYGILPIFLVVSYIGFGLVEPRFYSFENLINILTQSSYIIILTTGQLMALVTRGFDLSIGRVVSMISVTSALVMIGIMKIDHDAVVLAIFFGCMAGIAMGVVVGAINGFCVAYLRVSPFVVTLGMQGIALGIGSTISGGFPVSDIPVEFTNIFSSGSLLGVPAPMAVCLIVLGLAYLWLNYTVIGRSFFIIGANPRAAKVAGLSHKFHHATAYITCSIIVAIGALMLTARTGSGEPNLGGELMLNSIAAAVIGGVSLSGGEGRIIHCVLGGLLITILSNGMNLIRVGSYTQIIFLGIVIIAAIFIDRLRSLIK